MGAASLAITLWSLNATAAGAALEQLSVWRVLLCEFLAAFVIVGAFRLRRGPGRVDRAAAGLGALGLGATIVLQYVAFASAPLVAANAVAYAWPLLAATWLAARTRLPGRARTLGLAAVGFAGVLLVLAGSAGNDTGTSPVVGFLAAGGSAVAMAAYTVGAARQGSHVSDMLLVGTLAGAVAVAPPALLDSGGWGPVWAVGLSCAIGVGMLAVGYGLWSVAMASSRGARLAPLGYATPLLSTLVLLVTGESIGSIALVGCGLIVICAGGVALTGRSSTETRSGDERRPWRRAGTRRAVRRALLGRSA